MREPFEPLAVGAVTGDDHLERAVPCRRLEQEVDPLRAVEPVHGEDEVLVGVAVEVERRRRRREHRRVKPGRVAQPDRIRFRNAAGNGGYQVAHSAASSVRQLHGDPPE